MSARMPWSARAPAVPGPIAATVALAKARASRPAAASASNRSRSPVRARHAHERVGMNRARTRRGPPAESIRGTIRIVGSSITSAPSAASVAARPLACARALVTTTRRPKRGRRSSQAIVSRRAATEPMRMIDGGPIAGLGGRSRQLGEARGHRALRGDGPLLHGGRRLAAVSARRRSGARRSPAVASRPCTARAFPGRPQARPSRAPSRPWRDPRVR